MKKSIITIAVIVLLAAVGSWFLPEKEPSVNDSFEITKAFSRHRCDREASMLNQEVAVVVDKVGGKVVARLSAGNMIYMCLTEGDYLRILFPQDGTRVDCSRRKSDFCRHGLVKKPVKVEILG